jgi:uridine kinase
MKKKTLIIGISGPSASGKTLLAKSIVHDVNSNKIAVIAEDAYYKDQSNISKKSRNKKNYDHPNAFEHCLLFNHLRDMKDGKDIHVPTYDYSNHVRLNKKRSISSLNILIIEGILIFSDKKIRNIIDIKIFVDTPLDICLSRRILRDMRERGRNMHFILDQYKETVRPMYFQFIEPYKRYADIIIPQGGENKIAIDLIIAKINEILD